MIRKSAKLIVMIGLTVLIATPSISHAFDGKRKGFLLGFGAGFGATMYDRQDVIIYYGPGETFPVRIGEDESKVGIATDFKIGYGIDEQTQIYFSLSDGYFGYEFNNRKYTASVTVIGPGMKYCFQKTVPAWHIFGSLGYSSWDLPFEDGYDEVEGFGATMGGGYEFAKHWSVDLTLALSSIDNLFGPDPTTISSIRICINGLAY